MGTTNHTTNYELSQYVGSDVTSYLTNYNSDMSKIDTQMKNNADAAASAASDAATAVSTANTAATNATTAVSTANEANTAASAAQTAASEAQTAAGTAQTDAAAALRASASNTIGNLAPAYDPTLTYAVGDLVTYVDPDTNQGKLYKCIIAVASPEAFNINKWDDVTTSEVYNRKSEVVATFNGTTANTYKEALEYLFNNMGEIDLSAEYLLVETSETYGENTIHTRVVTTSGIQFTDIIADASSIRISTIYIYASSTRARTVLDNAGTYTYTDQSSNNLPVDMTFTLVKLSTI